MNSNTKTIIVITCLVLVIIISGLLSLYYLNVSAGRLEQNIGSASLSVTNNQWTEAADQLEDFEHIWEKTKFGWATMVDHFEIDNIDNSFTQAKKYVESQDYSSALAELETLRHYILHIPKKEGFSLENIL